MSRSSFGGLNSAPYFFCSALALATNCFAPFTGGALSYIDGIGAKEFVRIAKGLQKKYGAEFKAPKLLLDLAEKGETFYQRFDPYAKPDAKEAA